MSIRTAQHGFSFWFAVLLLALLLTLVSGCSDSDSESDGDLVNGDGLDGDETDTETGDGDSTDADTADGDSIDGDTTDGDIPDGDSIDGDTTDGDTIDADSTDGDLDEESVIPDGDLEWPELAEYGEYNETSLYQEPQASLDLLCGGSQRPMGDSIEMGYDCGEITTFMRSYNYNDEAVHFIPEQPVKVNKVRMVFTHAGPVAVRLVRDMARSQPDLEQLLAPEQTRMIQWREAQQWVEFDFSNDDVYVHPKDHFWVVYRHLVPFPMLGLAENCATQSHSMFRSDEAIAEWREQGQMFVWGGIQSGVNYMVRIEAEPFCQRGGTFFTDVSEQTVVAPNGEGDDSHIIDIKENRILSADINHDDWPDLVLHETANNVDDPDRVRVLLNDTAGGFLDFTTESGLNGYYTSLFAAGDVNNDGYVDLYGGVYTDQQNPNPGSDTVFLNDGAGHFTQVENAGVEETSTTSAATFIDYDRDGLLDLYVGNWLYQYPYSTAMPDFFFKGNGDGTFTDVSDQVGLDLEGQRWGQPCYGVTTCDWNNDGWTDIMVANYGYGRNLLWANTGLGGFNEVGVEAGLAYDAIGGTTGGNTFGIDCGDFDNDGNLDAFLAEIAHPRYQPDSDPSRLLRNTGSENDFAFENLTRDLGIYYDEGEVDAMWVDFDNDGDLDLFVASLYTLHFGRLYRQEWDHSFTDVTYLAGIWTHDSVGNNWIDYDRDGDLDLLVARRSTGAHLHLYRNDVDNGNHWLQIRLVGVDSNASAIGARVTVTTGDLQQIREVKGSKGHFSQQPPMTLHFGLGEHESIDHVTVRWPNGSETQFEQVAADRFYVATEGQTSLSDETP